MALGQKTNVFIGFLLLIVLFVGFWMLLTFIAEFLASQDIKFVVAATALTGAAIGAWIKSYLEGRHSVEEHFSRVCNMFCVTDVTPFLWTVYGLGFRQFF